MTTTPPPLTRELDRLADSLVDDTSAGPPADGLWRTAVRRRRRDVTLVVAALAAVLVVVAGTVLPPGGFPSAVPAAPPGTPLDGYPSRVAMPWRPATTSTPGPAALAVTTGDEAHRALLLVGPRGGLTRFAVPEGTPDAAVSLSPDGRLLGVGTVVHDLVTGRSTTVPGVVDGVPVLRFAPDSRRVWLDAGGGAGFVTGVDGRSVAVPGASTSSGALVAGAVGSFVPAGWLDADTLLGVRPRADGSVQLLTWRVGAEAWRAGASIGPPGSLSLDAGSGTARFSALLSPDATRLALVAHDPGTPAGDGVGEGQVLESVLLADPRTGARVAVPTRDGGRADTVSWLGRDCRPGWSDGSPLRTDGTVRAPADLAAPTLVEVSSAASARCVVLAGDALRGTADPNTVAVWQERARVVGPLLLLVLVAVLLLRGPVRRRTWRGDGPPPPEASPPLVR